MCEHTSSASRSSCSFKVNQGITQGSATDATTFLAVSTRKSNPCLEPHFSMHLESANCLCLHSINGTLFSSSPMKVVTPLARKLSRLGLRTKTGAQKSDISAPAKCHLPCLWSNKPSWLEPRGHHAQIWHWSCYCGPNVDVAREHLLHCLGLLDFCGRLLLWITHFAKLSGIHPLL